MTTTEYKSPRGTVGLITGPKGEPQWLYALESGAPGYYAIVWIYVDTPGVPRVLVATEAGASRWISLADLAGLSTDPGGAELLRMKLRLQGGTPFLIPGNGAIVYRDDGTGEEGYRQAQVFFDPYEGGLPTLLAQIGRAIENPYHAPAEGMRMTPSSAAITLELPGGPVGPGAKSGFSGSDASASQPTPPAPTAPPEGFGGPVTTSTALPVLALLALAGLLMAKSLPSR